MPLRELQKHLHAFNTNWPIWISTAVSRPLYRTCHI